MSRVTFFWIAITCMFFYEWIPGFLFPAIQVISVLCFFGSNGSGMGKPGSLNTKNFYSSASSGVGLFSFTLDWQYIMADYVKTPLWATLNLIFGNLFFMWVLTPILFETDGILKSVIVKYSNINALFFLVVGGINRMLTDDKSVTTALNKVNLYNGNPNSKQYKLGQNVPASKLFDNVTFSLNATAYEDVEPIHITSFWVSGYIGNFLCISSIFGHVIVWYGKDIVRRFKIMFGREKPDEEDEHVEFMKSYKDIPDLWFITFLACVTALMLGVNFFTPYRMPIWGVFLALFVAGVFTIPAGIIRGVCN